MPRPRKIEVAEGVDPRDVMVKMMQEKMNASATGDYLQGDAAQRIWGITIPYLAPQYLIGGSTVLPAQRYIGVSGLKKSGKSTFMHEIGSWYMASNGMYICQNTEPKDSDALEALDYYNKLKGSTVDTKRSRLGPKTVSSIEGWQNEMTDCLKLAIKAAELPKGKRLPILFAIDSLTGRGEKAQVAMMKEGAAEGRSYAAAIAANQITEYFHTMSLLGTTMNVGYIQHLAKDMSDADSYHEKGAAVMGYHTSAHFRAKRIDVVKAAGHVGAPNVEIPVEGFTILLKTVAGCVGSDIDRYLMVDLLWQYIPQEDGSHKQAMWFDWYGALARLLRDFKYSDKVKTFKYDQERLDKAIKFSQPKTNRINCEELGLKEAPLAEFGMKIECTPEVRDRVANFLYVKKYPDIQDAEIVLREEKEEE